MHPLATDTDLLNVVTGLHVTDKFNADEYIKFESGWPTSFNKTPIKNVTLMISTKKSIKLDGKPVYDTELIYTLLMYIQQYRYIDITYVLSGLGTFPSASIIIWWEWCYAGSIIGSPGDYTPCWTIKSDPMSAGCCHHRWMCHVVNRVAPMRTKWSTSWIPSNITYNALTST